MLIVIICENWIHALFGFKSDFPFFFFLGLKLFVSIFLAHPWVREGGDASEIPIDISVLSNMRQFVKYSRLKQFALRVKQAFFSLDYFFSFLFI